MLDRDLAILYNVETKVLNQAVKRNSYRFPKDFMFKLLKSEKDRLVTNCDRFSSLKYASSSPFAFTEQGVAMLSSVLNSKEAIIVNIQIIRTFTKLREFMKTHKKLKIKIEELEKKYNFQFKIVFDAIKKLIDTPEKPKKQIGFH